MREFWQEFVNQIPPSMVLLTYAFGLLLITWPLFLWLEKHSPVSNQSDVSRYKFNWKILLSNFLLTPLVYALAVATTLLVANRLNLPVLPYPVYEWSTGSAVVDAGFRAIAFFLTGCFLGDLWYYWWHRFQHTVPALWELHKLHHSDQAMNATTIYRSHFSELAGQALIRGLSVGLLVDLSGAEDTLVAALSAGLLPPIWDIFIHSNVRADRLSRLPPFFSTPQYHWIHHSKLPEHQDKNFAIWLPLFDVLFGSYYRPQVDEYPPTGLSSGERIETVWEAQAGPILAWFGKS
jgi:sterol desaturase/sphingolipid hydroxylase (fatty acid hydroxylase superfamily)